MHGCARPSGVQTPVRRFLLLFVLLLAAAAGADAQPRPSGSPAPDVDVSELPISVDRIEQDLQSPSAISLEVTRPLFRVEIVAPRPPDWLGNIDWLGTRDRIGPTVPVPSLHDQYRARVANLRGSLELQLGGGLLHAGLKLRVDLAAAAFQHLDGGVEVLCV